MLRSRRYVRRHNNRETNCRGLLATSPRSVEQLQTLRLAHGGPFLLLQIRHAEDAGKRAASRWSTLVHAVRGLVQDERPDLRRESAVLFSKSYCVTTRDSRCFDPHSFISCRF